MDVLTQAQKLLKETAYSSLQDLTVGLSNGNLILSGEVRSYHMKQIAISILRKTGCQIDATDLLVKAKE